LNIIDLASQFALNKVDVCPLLLPLPGPIFKKAYIPLGGWYILKINIPAQD